MAKEYPTPYQKRTLWKALTGLATVILAAILVGIVWLTGQVLGYLQPVLVPLAVAGIIAYLLDPVVTKLMSKGLSRIRAVITVFCGFVIAICIAAALVVPPLSQQIGKVLEKSEGEASFTEQALVKLEEFGDKDFVQPILQWAKQPVDENGNALVSPSSETIENTPFSQQKLGYLLNANASQISSTIFRWLRGATKVFGILGYTIGFAMVPIYLFYFLRESASIKQHWHKYVPLKASKFKNEVIDALTEINSYLISFFRGQVLVALIDGLLVGIALMIFQLPHALIIGLFLGILGIIPFIGNILCMIPACVIAFIHFSSDNAPHQWLGSSPWAYVGAVIAIFLIVQQINSLVTAPKIVGDSVGLHPMTVIFSMLFWSLLLGGFLGALLAVPLTAAVKVLIRRYVWERKIMDAPLPPPQEATQSA